jgi:regulator of sigma E protease
MFERRRDAVTIDVARQTKEGSSASTASIKVEPARMRSLGLRMTMGDVIAVREGSPAARAVDPEGKPKPVEAGDQIIEIDGSNNFDPMRLADLIADKAGQRVELTVRRKARTPELFKVIVVPDSSPSWNDFPHIGLFPTETAMSVPALGLAYNVGSVVLAVDADGPAGKSGKIQANDVVTKVTYFAPAPPQPAESRWWMRWWNWLSGGGQPVVPVVSKEELESYPFEVKESNWPGAFWGLQSSDVEKVVLQVTRTTGAEKKETVDVELIPSDDASWPFHLRGLNFLDERRDQKASGLLEAVQMGWDYTWTTMSRVYLTLRGLILGDLNPELLSGPLRLGYTAYIVSEDFMTLVRLIGLINVNLAVVNFLPIPVLDGGHMVFLLYEAIFRRKPNEKLLYASYYVGFACILLLMSFVLYLDIKHLWFDRM